MTALMGIVRGGRVELDSPTELPDGTRVRVEPSDEDDGFLTDDTWPTTQEEIEALASRMENFDPVVLTAEDAREHQSDARGRTSGVNSTMVDGSRQLGRGQLKRDFELAG